MPRDLILGTAGHIDHGKTSLVKALTGVDCDRLPEEKARGITIDIGFAHLELDGVRLGIVDVPGHERFIKNMLAGATGIDCALLVVAADDGIMPQTREHLEILQLLNIQHGIIALTKADLVDETTREVVALEIRDLVQGTFLEKAPIIPTSAHSGLGLAELKAALAALCQRIEQHPATEWFRLAIDRAFVVQGHGTVVTGSVVSGCVRVGDELAWHVGQGQMEVVRVRNLNNHGQPVEAVHRGQRAAINLAGVPLERVRRGQELATPGYLCPARVLTVQLQAASQARHPLKHRLPVRLHLGTAEVMATLSLLDGNSLNPGERGLGQLFVTEPVTAVWGQPFVLRDSSAEHTLGGGRVLQPTARKIRRRHLEAIEQIERLGASSAGQRALAVAWFAGYRGFTPSDLVREAGVPPNEILNTPQELLNTGQLVQLSLSSHRGVLVHADRVSELEQLVMQTLARLHTEQPLLTSHDRQQVLARLDFVGDSEVLQAVIDRLIANRQLVGDSRRMARADFKPKLSANQRKLKDKIVEAHRTARFTPPEPKEFAPQAGGHAAALHDIYEVACAEGLLVKITSDIYLAAEAEEEMRRLLRERLEHSPGLTVAEIRDLLQTTRKFAVPLCEYLDRIGLTRRQGDLRVLQASTTESVG
ncbi:MAG: selenocysteine-specific translation elongation factor [Gemmataceae bacterium]|nr:selenocysteine-specific translation elongation factor [Gemmata sp.]MDW8196668.1 selenocysteine-specific translation elongation factor [Gemmataceae bacterium]